MALDWLAPNINFLLRELYGCGLDRYNYKISRRSSYQNQRVDKIVNTNTEQDAVSSGYLWYLFLLLYTRPESADVCRWWEFTANIGLVNKYKELWPSVWYNDHINRRRSFFMMGKQDNQIQMVILDIDSMDSIRLSSETNKKLCKL